MGDIHRLQADIKDLTYLVRNASQWGVSNRFSSFDAASFTRLMKTTAALLHMLLDAGGKREGHLGLHRVHGLGNAESSESHCQGRFECKDLNGEDVFCVFMCLLPSEPLAVPFDVSRP